MPRKAFVADLQAATVATDLPVTVSGLSAGEEDGSFNFTYRTPGDDDAVLVVLQAQVSDVGDYPDSHSFFVYSTSENVPQAINESLDDPSIFDGLTVSQLLAKAAKRLDKATAGREDNPIELDGGDDDEDMLDAEDEYEEEQTYSDEDFDDGVSSTREKYSATSPAFTVSQGPSLLDYREFQDRVRSDLQQVKLAGFRISCHGQPLIPNHDCYITISCRIAKLNIPEDALAAWNLDPKKYFLLIIHHANGYQPLEGLHDASRSAKVQTTFRVGVSDKHRISLQDTINAFSTAHPEKKQRTTGGSLRFEAPNGSTSDADSIRSNESHNAIERFFIDRSLNELLNGRFLDLVKHRSLHGFTWHGAETFVDEYQGKDLNGNEGLSAKYFAPEAEVKQHLSPLVSDDHFSGSSRRKSFVLISMQFTLRHLVRCTEFCLVCHTRITASFEALKPYVCSKPLCLYQYMALGFGPSIEHEILTQPYVVDLLISFGYASALAGTLKDLPVGMGLQVPHTTKLFAPETQQTGPLPQTGSIATPQSKVVTTKKPWVPTHSTIIKAKYDEARDELSFPYDMQEKPISVGQWLLIEYSKLDQEDKVSQHIRHRKVIETWYPRVSLGDPTKQYSALPNEALSISTSKDSASKESVKASSNRQNLVYEVSVRIYNHLLDDCSLKAQQATICMLLNTIPSVTEMKNYLLQPQNRNKPLTTWNYRISPAAFGVLRWIIASNRSCIVQVDDPLSKTQNDADRVFGMDGYIQFRLAQGAPDKEQRFIDAVNKTKERLKQKTPTVFAWHGSPIKNWNGILREGLHYNEVAHGRAYGDGVYHAMDAATSQGYSGQAYGQVGSKVPYWEKSELRVQSALSLNEIVNAPDEFKSKNPYLVVQHVDWIQTRYLFVSSAKEEDPMIWDTIANHVPKPPELVLPQDDKLTPRGRDRKPIVIPISAISKARQESAQPSHLKLGWKKLKTIGKSKDIDEPEFVSDESDAEDRAILLAPKQAESKAPAARSRTPKIPFVPGSLDLSSLPLLPPPTYATSQATKALQREMKAMIKLQNSVPASEIPDLGWHLCMDALNNVYQWIVELHSFDLTIPFAREMQAKKLNSIVVELRFGPSFPYSPPFVRVIRPRFIPFSQGGGGHVTAGGALCMELLTNDGWSAASTIEAVLLQVHMALCNLEPYPAKLTAGAVSDYGAGEALQAYKRACMMHGVSYGLPCG